MYKISIVGLQGGTGYASEIEFLSETDTSDETVVQLINISDYTPVAMEVEYVGLV